MINSGDKPVSFSTLSFIARAVATILSQPDKTANQYFAIASFSATQNQLLRIVQEISGEEWKVERLRGADVEKAGRDRVAAGDRSGIVDLLRAYFFGDGSDNKADDSANGLLGLEHGEPRATIEAWLSVELDYS